MELFHIIDNIKDVSRIKGVGKRFPTPLMKSMDDVTGLALHHLNGKSVVFDFLAHLGGFIGGGVGADGQTRCAA